jgi:hypothetical protein
MKTGPGLPHGGGCLYLRLSGPPRQVAGTATPCDRCAEVAPLAGENSQTGPGLRDARLKAQALQECQAPPVALLRRGKLASTARLLTT